MNWSRAKTILIFLFLFTDLFLLANITYTYQSAKISPEIIESTAQILSANNIKIDTSLIPTRNPGAPYAEAENIISDYDTFAKHFLGEDFVKTGNSYEASGNKIIFSGDSFSYSSATATLSDADEKTAITVATDFLTDKGFDLSSATVRAEKKDNSYSVTFESTANSLTVFNSRITIQVSGSNIFTAHGTWFETISAKGDDNEIKSAVSALIDTIPHIGGKASEITDISLGYKIPESTSYRKTAVLVPVWSITTSSGESYYTDARNPE